MGSGLNKQAAGFDQKPAACDYWQINKTKLTHIMRPVYVATAGPLQRRHNQPALIRGERAFCVDALFEWIPDTIKFAGKLLL